MNQEETPMNLAIDFDEQLYHDLKTGSEKAFASVFNRYHRLLYALAFRYLKSGSEAEDAVQYTFMRMWESGKALIFPSACVAFCSPS